MLFQTGSNIFSRFQEEFDGLVNVLYAVENKQSIVLKDGYQRELYRRASLATRRNSFSVSREDIEQELRLIWYRLYTNRQNWQTQSIKSYLLRLSIFDLSFWYTKELRVPDRELKEIEDESLVLPSLYFLSAFQIYMIYLHFIQGLSIVKLSKILKKDKRTVRKLLRETIRKVKKHVNYGSTDASRPSCTRRRL